MSVNKIRELIRQGEGQTIEFKDSRFLSNSFDLAQLMVAFANADGGTILIGVRDTGEIEGMTAKNGHEEYIMNVASDKCDPPIRPSFKTIRYNNIGDVYLATIPKGLHGVKMEGGVAFYIRVGSTIRAMTPEEIREKILDEEIGRKLGPSRIALDIPPSGDVYFDETSQSYRRVIIVPKNMAREIISFGKGVDDWLYNHRPNNLTFGYPNPTQTGLVFNYDKPTKKEYYAEITKEGLIHYGELVVGEFGGVHIGRTIMVIGRMLEYSQKVYGHFGFSGPLKIELKLGNVKDKKLTTDPGRHLSRDYVCEQNEVIVGRETSFDELKDNPNSIVESIIIEFCRGFGFVISEEVVKEYVATTLRTE